MPRGRKPRHESEKLAENPTMQFKEYPSTPYDGPAPDLPELQGGWSQETLYYWGALSTMPQCVDWRAGDWEFAFMTCLIHQRIVSNPRTSVTWFTELRARESRMGVTLESRVTMRIRYVDPVTGKNEMDPEYKEPETNVTQMDKFRELYG